MKRAVLRTGVAVVLVAALAWAVDFSAVLANLGEADPLLYAAGAALFMTTYLPSGLRWRMLASSSGHESSLAEATKVVAISYSLNKLLPWNTGDFAKTKLAERYQDVESHSRLMGVVALERALDATSLLFIIALSLPLASAEALGRLLWILVPFVLALFASAAVAARRPSLVERMLPERLREVYTELVEGFSSCSMRELAAGSALSIWKWGTEALVFLLLASALGIGLDFWSSALVNSVISLVSALPISPAGLGPADATATGILALSGVETSAALSVVVLWRSIGIGLQGIIGALVYAAGR